jgi:DUF2075 family protein
MIVYKNTKKDFLKEFNNIENILSANLKYILNINVSKSEKESWKNSLKEIYYVLKCSSFPDDGLILLEYQIPSTSKRIDVCFIGKDKDSNNIMLILELKQWEKIEPTDMDAVVKTFLGKKIREVIHPAYQVWSYKRLLEDFNIYVRKNVKVNTAVFMHNMNKNNNIIENYKEWTEKTELFFKGEDEKLSKFISQIKKPIDFTESIENSAIVPSKTLIDSLVNMLKGKEEFTLIDSQKLVFEKAKKLKPKSVYIVKGGPGSGKSVVAINLLVEFIKRKKNARYVTKNATPREVYKVKLKGDFKVKEIDNLFVSSGGFTNTLENEFDFLIVDEAHRLNAKSGLFNNKGENQIKEIIYSSKVSIFFIDEDQKVTLKDIGEIDEIKKWADFYGVKVYEDELDTQFRCNGSDGYLAWVDDVLEIKESANKTLDGIDYEVKIFDNVNDMYKELQNKQKNFRVGLVAGYCWDWKSKKENVDDIVIGNFSKKWNLAEDGGLWSLKNPLNQVGCIHTVQGLEFDYIGVIIGDDLRYENRIITDPEKRAKTDKSLHGYKKLLKENTQNMEVVDKIIKNTYRVLMTRGMKGCYIYTTDKKLREYLKKRIKK